MELAHVGAQSGLVAHRAGQMPQQRGHFGPSLDETEDVVDEEQHVAALIAEVFGLRHGGQSNPQASARRFIHLAKDHHGAVDHARLAHFIPQVITLATALAHTGKYRVAMVELGDVVDQFLDDDCLAHASTTKDRRLTAFGERCDQVDHLDAGLEDLRRGGLLCQRGRRSMDGIMVSGLYGLVAVDSLPQNVENSAQGAWSYRHGDRFAGSDYRHTAIQTVGAGHSYRAHPAVA